MTRINYEYIHLFELMHNEGGAFASKPLPDKDYLYVFLMASDIYWVLCTFEDDASSFPVYYSLKELNEEIEKYVLISPEDMEREMEFLSETDYCTLSSPEEYKEWLEQKEKA